MIKDSHRNTLNLKIGVNEDVILLLSSHPEINYTTRCNLTLDIKDPITQHQLMRLIASLYQNLYTLNENIQFAIFPTPLSLVKVTTFGKTCLGGTFDHLHAGHFLLLTAGCLLTEEELTVGITAPSMLGKKKQHEFLQSYAYREEEVGAFLTQLKPSIKYRLVQLKEPYGPPICEEDYQAIVVSRETIPGANQINQIRTNTGWDPLHIHPVELIEPKATEQKISSTSIRNKLSLKNRMTSEGMMQKYSNTWVQITNKLMTQYKSLNNDAVRRSSEIEFDRLFGQYSQPWRFYHTNQHINSMVTENYILPEVKLKREELAICYAILYHDVVHDPRSKTNEEDSVKRWRQYTDKLQGVFADSLEWLVEAVSSLILATKLHKPENPLEERLIDLDMGILDSDSSEYQQYAEDIRNQYGPLFPSEQSYRQKRKEFLTSLDSSQVYSHRQARRIKHNIQWEIQLREFMQGGAESVSASVDLSA